MQADTLLGFPVLSDLGNRGNDRTRRMGHGQDSFPLYLDSQEGMEKKRADLIAAAVAQYESV